ncbi:MAG: MarR family winged helix-turn-helix transcriptional regulator [Acidimicrobiales bacterium]|jgi:DNA-binding MarR family transcriptional regulator
MDREALLGRLFELVRESQRQNDRFDQAVADYLGVSRTEAHCLDILDQFGPMTAGQLAELSGLTTGAITKVADRLEDAGYVSRARDPVDRRRVIVDLTPELRRLAGELYEIPEPLMADFQAQFSERDLRVLIAYFERGSELADVRQARLASKIHKYAGSSGAP